MGVVRENQLGGDLVKNVSVSALGAHPVVTGADGQFVLNFPQRKPGENVSIDVSRNGWVVVNDIQLKRALPVNAAQSPLEILSEERLKQQGADAKKLHEDTMRSWLLRGQLLAVKFDFDGATRAYVAAMAFSPDSYEAWFAYSSFHQGQNHFKESHQGYETALMLARASGKEEDMAGGPSTTWASCTAMGTAWRMRGPPMRKH